MNFDLSTNSNSLEEETFEEGYAASSTESVFEEDSKMSADVDLSDEYEDMNTVEDTFETEQAKKKRKMTWITIGITAGLAVLSLCLVVTLIGSQKTQEKDIKKWVAEYLTEKMSDELSDEDIARIAEEATPSLISFVGDDGTFDLSALSPEELNSLISQIKQPLLDSLSEDEANTLSEKIISSYIERTTGVEGLAEYDLASISERLAELEANDVTIAQEIKNTAGKDGKDGKDGERGATGATGATGAKGATGERGAQGAQGATGAKGERGEKGAQGDKGLKGDKGEKGDTGATGAAGTSVYSFYYIYDEVSGSKSPIYEKMPDKDDVKEDQSVYMLTMTGFTKPAEAKAQAITTIENPGVYGTKVSARDGKDGLDGEKGEKGEDGLNGTSVKIAYGVYDKRDGKTTWFYDFESAKQFADTDPENRSIASQAMYEVESGTTIPAGAIDLSNVPKNIKGEELTSLVETILNQITNNTTEYTGGNASIEFNKDTQTLIIFSN